MQKGLKKYLSICYTLCLSFDVFSLFWWIENESVLLNSSGMSFEYVGTGFLRIAAVILHKRSDCWIENTKEERSASIKYSFHGQGRHKSCVNSVASVRESIVLLVKQRSGLGRCNSLQKTLNNRSKCWIGNSKSQWTCLPFITTSIYFLGNPSRSSNRGQIELFYSTVLRIKSKYYKLWSGKVRCIGIEKTLYLLADDSRSLAVQREGGEACLASALARARGGIPGLAKALCTGASPGSR